MDVRAACVHEMLRLMWLYMQIITCISTSCKLFRPKSTQHSQLFTHINTQLRRAWVLHLGLFRMWTCLSLVAVMSETKVLINLFFVYLYQTFVIVVGTSVVELTWSLLYQELLLMLKCIEEIISFCTALIDQKNVIWPSKNLLQNSVELVCWKMNLLTQVCVVWIKDIWYSKNLECSANGKLPLSNG